jgi:surfeit locus 1 family protein
MNFTFSFKITLTTLLLASGMIVASVWQWNRHLQKQELIRRLEETLLLQPIELSTLLKRKTDWSSIVFRRVKVAGEYDFKHEVLLRNRNREGRAGFHVVTPLKLDSTDAYILIDRGFLPLGQESKEQRAQYQQPARAEFVGLLKEPATPKIFAPNDPPAGPDKPWVDQWLRVDVAAIEKQMPYRLQPIFLEIMSNPDDPMLPSQVVRESAAGRSDVLMYTGKQVENFGLSSAQGEYPIPTYDITPPPDIHLGYVYEWAFMALLTVAIGAVLQFRRPKSPSTR